MLIKEPKVSGNKYFQLECTLRTNFMQINARQLLLCKTFLKVPLRRHQKHKYLSRPREKIKTFALKRERTVMCTVALTQVIQF